MRTIIAITGATGFIGHRLVEVLSARPSMAVRVLVRNRDAMARASFSGEVAQGDMRDPAAFGRLLEAGGTWVNVAQLDMPSESEQIAAMASLLEVCRKKRVRRIVHCSSAVVVGRSSDSVISEATPCQPGDRYESTKLAIERLLFREAGDAVEVVVLRPTAVFGPGGRNLIKLARDLERRPRFVNYLKSSLQGGRRMNLVHVDNVVASLMFLVDTADGVAGETFIVSDDEFPDNNYRDVERLMMAGLGIPDYALAPLPALRRTLPFALRATGRTNSNPDRVYDCSKIRRLGLDKPVDFERGLADFLAWYRSRDSSATAP